MSNPLIRTDQKTYTDLVFSVLKIVQLDATRPIEINFEDAIFRSSSGRVLNAKDIQVINLK